MQAEYLKRKTEDYIYAYTEDLAQHEDLHPCDKDGNFLNVASPAPVAAGLKPQNTMMDVVIQNIMSSLNVPEDVARNIATGKIEAPGPEKQTPEDRQAEIDKAFIDPLEGLKPKGMVEYAKEKFGDKAKHLYLAMGAVKLRAEIERLEAE